MRNIVSIIMVIVLISGISLAQTDGNAGTSGNGTGSSEGSSEAIQAAAIQGIWSVDLSGADKVTVALRQSSGQVCGSAKSEGSDPWNAVVAGSIYGSRVELTIISLKGSSLVITKLMGTIVRGTLTGIYLQSDDLGGYSNNLFTATLVNTDTSSYLPAKIEALNPPATAGSTSQTEVPPETDTSSSTGPVITSPIAPVPVSETTKPVQLGNTYKNVHSIASTVPESLGVGFIGDGTMGAGGASMS